MKREDIEYGMKIVSLKDVYSEYDGKIMFKKGDICTVLPGYSDNSLVAEDGMFLYRVGRPGYYDYNRLQFFEPYIEPTKKMTVAEIEAKLGHKVEVISDV